LHFLFYFQLKDQDIQAGDIVLFSKEKITNQGFEQDMVSPRVVASAPSVSGIFQGAKSGKVLIARAGQVLVNLYSDVETSEGDFIAAGNTFIKKKNK